MQVSPNFKVITFEHIEKSYRYEDYKELIIRLLQEHKTTGQNHSEEYVAYTRLNLQRMHRWEKQIVIEPEFREFLRHFKKRIFLVGLVEAWCGDVANVVTLFEKVRLENPEFISLHLLLRDENEEVMQDNLTAGARSIPKLIFLDEHLEKLATWGPRAQPLLALISQWKSEGIPKSELNEKIQRWYLQDKSRTTQKELFEIFKRL